MTISKPTDELLPCPFCGKGGSMVSPFKNQNDKWQIGCGRCGMQSGWRADDDLVLLKEHWNARQPDAALAQKEIERLRAIIAEDGKELDRLAAGWKQAEQELSSLTKAQVE